MTVRYRKDRQQWMVDINLPDHPRIRKIIPEAQNKSQALQAEKNIITSLFDKKYGVAKAPTLQAFIDSTYLPWAIINKKSWKTDRSHCDVLVRFFGKKSLDQLSPFEIERFKKLRQEEKTKGKKFISATTVNRTLEVLGKIYSLAIKNGVVHKNPCQAVPKLKVRSRRYRILSAEEEKRLLAVLVNRRAYLLDLVLLDLATGLRKGELLKLRWGNVNLLQSVLTVKDTKTGRDRFIPLTQRAQDILARLSQEKASEFVFPSPIDLTKPRTEIKKGWKAALREAQITDFHFHDLRHTMATRLAEATNNAFVVQQVLGHSNIQTSLIYVNMQADFLREGMEEMGRRWHQAGTKKKTGTD